MADLRDQYCVRLPGGPDQARAGYALYRLTKRELGKVIREKATWREVAAGRAPTAGRHHPTARRRGAPPAPLRAAVKDFGRCKRALYHGVGRDRPGLALLEKHCDAAVGYAPYHPDGRTTRLPRGTFDEVVSIFTLNVLDRAEGKKALRQIHRKLRRGGHATIAVRTDVCSRYPGSRLRLLELNRNASGQRSVEPLAGAKRKPKPKLPVF